MAGGMLVAGSRHERVRGLFCLMDCCLVEVATVATSEGGGEGGREGERE